MIILSDDNGDSDENDGGDDDDNDDDLMMMMIWWWSSLHIVEVTNEPPQSDDYWMIRMVRRMIVMMLITMVLVMIMIQSPYCGRDQGSTSIGLHAIFPALHWLSWSSLENIRKLRRIFFLSSSRAVKKSPFTLLFAQYVFLPIEQERHISKFVSWYTIWHIFVQACSFGRKTWFLRKLWFS